MKQKLFTPQSMFGTYFSFWCVQLHPKNPVEKKIKVNQTALSRDEKQDEVIEPSGNAA